MTADLLVLDDLGAEKTSEWVEETLNLIVNTRYNERRADDLHVELRRHRKTDRSRTRSCAGSASACARASTRCATSSSSRAPTIGFAPPNAADKDCSRWPSGKEKGGRGVAPCRPAPGPRPASRASGRPEVARRARRHVGSDPCRPSASTSTCRSARPSATTAISTGACPTRRSSGDTWRRSSRRSRQRLPACRAGRRTRRRGRHRLLRRRHAVAARERRGRRHPRRLPRRVRRGARRRSDARGEPRDRRRAPCSSASGAPASTG